MNLNDRARWPAVAIEAVRRRRGDTAPQLAPNG